MALVVNRKESHLLILVSLVLFYILHFNQVKANLYYDNQRENDLALSHYHLRNKLLELFRQHNSEGFQFNQENLDNAPSVIDKANIQEELTTYLKYLVPHAEKESATTQIDGLMDLVHSLPEDVIQEFIRTYIFSKPGHNLLFKNEEADLMQTINKKLKEGNSTVPISQLIDLINGFPKDLIQGLIQQFLKEYIDQNSKSDGKDKNTAAKLTKLAIPRLTKSAYGIPEDLTEWFLENFILNSKAKDLENYNETEENNVQKNFVY